MSIQFGKAGSKSFLTKDIPKVDTLAEFTGEERAKVEAYRARAKAEAKRFQHATDSEFWLAVCFPTEGDREAFRAEFGIQGDWVHGEAFAAALEPFRPAVKRRGFGGKVSAVFMRAKTVDPLAGIAYTGDLAADALAELAAIHAAFQAVTPPEPLQDVTDSDIYFTVVFEHRDAKDQFLEDFNLAGVGDKYIDGGKLAKKLRSTR